MNGNGAAVFACSVFLEIVPDSGWLFAELWYGHQQEAYLGSVLDQLQLLSLLIDAVKLEEVRVVEGDATQMKR